MTIRAAILGASGYVGAELLRLLAQHPDIDAVSLYAETSAGGRVADLYPHLAPAYGEAAFAAVADADFSACDLVLAALPHGRSQDLAPAVVAAGVPFVDLGADFRLKDADTYAQWYGEAH
ncbi:MAG: saccharopine dehydrogenase NADP-binding domain-containing protein, partial [Caulobacteraceae bacterium]